VSSSRRPVRSRARDERGAVIVEFALLLPVFVMLLLGMISGGIALHHKIVMTEAARDSSRFGATLAQDECGGSGCGGLTWAQLVRNQAVQRSDGEVVASQVCVALVSGPGSAPVAVSSSHTTAGGTSACFVDNSADSGKRVQVVLQKPDKVEWLVATSNITITTRSVARYEQ
jgi:Flp pilus assembly protein TadG